MAPLLRFIVQEATAEAAAAKIAAIIEELPVGGMSWGKSGEYQRVFQIGKEREGGFVGCWL